MESTKPSKKRLKVNFEDSAFHNLDSSDDDSMATAMEPSTSKKGDYSQFGPRTVGLLNKLLSTISDNLDKGLEEDIFIAHCLADGDVPQPHQTNTTEFVKEIDKLRSLLSDNLYKFTDTDLKNNVQSGLFDTFKSLRTEMHQWFRSTDHFCKRSGHNPNDAKKLMQISINFSPAVTDNEDIDRITAIISKFTNRLEIELQNTVVKKLRLLHTKLLDKWLSISNQEERFMWAKLYKITLRTFKAYHRNSTTPTHATDEDSSLGESSTSAFHRGRGRGGRRRGSLRHKSRRRDHTDSPDFDDHSRPRYRQPRRRHYSRYEQSSSPDDDESDYYGDYRHHKSRRNSSANHLRGSFRRIP